MKEKVSQKDALDMLLKMNVGFGQQNLIYYAQTGDLNIAELLLQAGANPNGSWKNEQKKMIVYPLHNTAGYGKVEMVQLLLEYGANVNLQDGIGETALMYAIASGKIETVKLLIDKGANLNQQSNNKLNAFYFATEGKNTAIISLLKQAGAEEMSTDEIANFKKTLLRKRVAVIAVIIVVIGLIIYGLNSGSSSSSYSSSSSGSSSSSNSKTCSYCGKSFSSNGWSSAGGEQYQPTDPRDGIYCSKKCAYESQPSNWKR